MNLWPLLLVFAMLGLMIIPLIPAFVELRLKRDADPVKIGRSAYLDIESYSRGFEGFLKNKFKDLLGTDLSFVTNENKEGTFNGMPYIYLKKMVERQELVSDIEKNNLYTQKMILAQQDLELPSNMLYENEVFTEGTLSTGRNNYLKAALAYGDIFVQPNTEVLRWITSRGTLHAQGPTTFHGRISAARKIHMEGESLFKWMAAPEIETNPSISVSNMAADYKEAIHYVDTPIQQIESTDIIDVNESVAFIRGDFAPPARWRTSLNIIATGKIILRENSCILGQIKANDDLTIGAGSKLLSSAVSSKNILVRQGACITGPLISEEKIEMISATVGQEGSLSSVYAREISLIGACHIYGSAYAEDKGIVRKI